MLPVLILTIVLIVPFWVLIIRPQQQRQRDHRSFVETLAPGDRIEAFSGIHGTIAEVGDDTVGVEVAPGVVVTMAKLAISSRIGEPAARPTPSAAGAAPTTEDPVLPTDLPAATPADHEGGAA